MNEQLHLPERRRKLTPTEARFTADCILAVPVEQRAARALDLQLEEPDTLMVLIRRLHERREEAPEAVRDDAEFFYRFLEKPRRQIGVLDERAYFLSEFALIAGVACRHLSLRTEARVWFDRSEASFLHVIHELPHFTRLTYQRLAVRMEERQLEEVADLLPAVSQSFTNLRMGKHALKCRTLEGAVLIEAGRFREALEVFDAIRRDAEALGSVELLGATLVNLTQLHARLGESEKALAAVREAAPLLRRSGNRVALAKLQWGVGDMFRQQLQAAGRMDSAQREDRLWSAIEAYRAAQKEFAGIGMNADIAALHLVIADLLLDLGKDGQALSEVQTALPVIERYKLVSEGFAALSLLRESLNNQRIDRTALRELHGYFEELGA